MISSMTAYARSSEGRSKTGWNAEFRSLNHRYFDFSVKLPPELLEFESAIRELVNGRIARGKVTLLLTRKNAEGDANSYDVDMEVVEGYLKSFKKLKSKFRLDGEVAVQDVLRIPQLFSNKGKKISASKEWPRIKKSVLEVIDLALKQRLVEGKKMEHDIRKRLGFIEKAATTVKGNLKKRATYYRKKFKQRIQEILGQVNVDEDRLWREFAFMMDRSDVTEELVRLKSHLELFCKRLTQKGAIGRELDFLCQEMNREVNTLGSKAQFFEISKEVVFIKGEIEKIREQVQNIE